MQTTATSRGPNTMPQSREEGHKRQVAAGKQMSANENTLPSDQLTGGEATDASATRPINTYVVLDGRNVTPKSLMSALERQKKDELRVMPRKAAEELKEELRKYEEQWQRPSGTMQQTSEQSSTVGRSERKSSITYGEDRMLEVLLEETPTMVLVDLPSNAASIDQKEAYDKIIASNEDYEALLNRKQNAPDQFRGQHTQTINYANKMKETLTDPP
ncbi:WD repeat domain 78, partial [Perkinsus chesapeaki]